MRIVSKIRINSDYSVQVSKHYFSQFNPFFVVCVKRNRINFVDFQVNLGGNWEINHILGLAPDKAVQSDDKYRDRVLLPDYCPLD